MHIGQWSKPSKHLVLQQQDVGQILFGCNPGRHISCKDVRTLYAGITKSKEKGGEERGKNIKIRENDRIWQTIGGRNRDER